MSNVDQNTTNATEQTGQSGVSRRKLMRAGLSAAPVLATLHARSALATGNSTGPVTVSAYCSLQNAAATGASHHPAGDGSDYHCKTPSSCGDSEYKHRKFCGTVSNDDRDDGMDGECGFYKPSNKKLVACKKKDSSYGDRSRNTKWGVKKYRLEDNDDRRCDDFTVEELCKSKSTDKLTELAKYCATAWVSCKESTPDRQVLGESDCKGIWQTFSSGGTSAKWKPTSGGKQIPGAGEWSFDTTLSYMKRCFPDT